MEEGRGKVQCLTSADVGRGFTDSVAGGAGIKNAWGVGSHFIDSFSGAYQPKPGFVRRVLNPMLLLKLNITRRSRTEKIKKGGQDNEESNSGIL